MHGTKIAIEDFLSVPLPEEIIVPEGPVKFFAKEDINGLILEREPFFWIDRAVSVGNDFLLASAKISAEQCDGHFPGHPVVPLIEIFRIAAQAGLLLAALNISPVHEPIAGGSGKNRAKTDVFIGAPVVLLAEVQKTAFKMALHFINARIFAHNIEIATAENIVYSAVLKSEILSKIK